MKVVRITLFYVLLLPFLMAALLLLFVLSISSSASSFSAENLIDTLSMMYQSGALLALGCGVYVGLCHDKSKHVKRHIRALLSLVLGFFGGFFVAHGTVRCPDTCAIFSPEMAPMALVVGVLWCVLELLFYSLIVKRVFKPTKVVTP